MSREGGESSCDQTLVMWGVGGSPCRSERRQVERYDSPLPLLLPHLFSLSTSVLPPTHTVQYTQYLLTLASQFCEFENETAMYHVSGVMMFPPPTLFTKMNTHEEMGVMHSSWVPRDCWSPASGKIAFPGKIADPQVW
jgi:hypothetical protein